MLQVLPEQVNTEVESDPLRPARPITWSKNKNTWCENTATAYIEIWT